MTKPKSYRIGYKEASGFQPEPEEQSEHKQYNHAVATPTIPQNPECRASNTYTRRSLAPKSELPSPFVVQSGLRIIWRAKQQNSNTYPPASMHYLLSISRGRYQDILVDEDSKLPCQIKVELVMIHVNSRFAAEIRITQSRVKSRPTHMCTYVKLQKPSVAQSTIPSHYQRRLIGTSTTPPHRRRYLDMQTESGH